MNILKAKRAWLCGYDLCPSNFKFSVCEECFVFHCYNCEIFLCCFPLLKLQFFCVQARPVLNGGKFAQILDPSLGCGYDSDLMERMMLAATLCIRRSPRARPHMSLVSTLKLSYVYCAPCMSSLVRFKLKTC